MPVLKFRTPNGIIEIALIPLGTGQGLKVHHNGTTYEIKLVNLAHELASKIRFKHHTLGKVAYSLTWMYRQLVETISLADTASRKLIGEVTDTFGFLDTAIIFLENAIHVYELLTLSDSFVGKMWGTITETLSLADEALKKYVLTPTDSFSFGDATAWFLASIKAETLSLSDSMTQKLKKALTDGLGLGDSIDQRLEGLVSDSFSFADSAVRSLFRNIGDTLSLTDEPLSMRLRKTLTEALSLFDAFSRALIGGPLDGFSFMDSIGGLFESIKVETLSLGDSMSRKLGESLFEGLSFSDASTGKFEGIPTDSIGFQDSVARTEYAYFGSFKFGEMKFGYEHPS